MPNYNDLIAVKGTVGSIRNWVNNDEVPAATIVTEAEAWIYQRLRVREMIARVTGTLTTSIDNIPLPADYQDSVKFMFTATATTAKFSPSFKPLSDVLDAWNYDGTARATGLPRYWGLTGTSIQFNDPADRNYPWHLEYYRIPPALSTATASSTNFLTSRYPKMLRAACAAGAYEWLRNEKEKIYWQSVAAREIADASRTADLAYAGSDMTMEIV